LIALSNVSAYDNFIRLDERFINQSFFGNDCEKMDLKTFMMDYFTETNNSTQQQAAAASFFEGHRP
jgi:hypothetical protein